MITNFDVCVIIVIVMTKNGAHEIMNKFSYCQNNSIIQSYEFIYIKEETLEYFLKIRQIINNSSLKMNYFMDYANVTIRIILSNQLKITS